jgi:hypothetical protein
MMGAAGANQWYFQIFCDPFLKIIFRWIVVLSRIACKTQHNAL